VTAAVTGDGRVDALSTAAREQSGVRRTVVVRRHTHPAAVPQHQTDVVRTAAFDAVAARRADVRTPAIVVVARITACNPRRYNTIQYNALVEDCQRFLNFLPASYQADVKTVKKT